MKDKMKCPKCGKGMQAVEPGKPYKYTASGLDNVYLIGFDIYECACGDGMIMLPQIGDLHRFMAIAILKKPAFLIGKELKFLRKHFRLKAVELAEKLNVSKTTVSRWENEEEPIGLANDRLVRILFMLNFVAELSKARLFAETGKRILNERGLDEIYSIFDLPVKRQKRFPINIEEKNLRQLDPFFLVDA